MKLTPRSLVFCLLLGSAAAIERLPIADFTRTPGAARVRLSPDGKMLAFIRDHVGKATMHFIELDNKGNVSRLDLGEAELANGATKSVGNFTWIGNNRVVVTTVVYDNALYGVTATNWNGAQNMAISGYEDTKVRVTGAVGGMISYEARSRLREVIHAFNDEDQAILMLDRHETGAGSANRPDIMKVNTLTGLASLAVKNPGEVARWGLDFDGVARLGITSHGEKSGAIYRADEKSEWKTILPLQPRRGQLHPLGFDAANDKVFVADLTDDRRWAIFRLDPVDGSLGEPVVKDPVYDIVPESYIPSIDGIALASPILSRKSRTLVGVRYVSDLPRVKWLDRDFARHQVGIDRGLPDTLNILVNTSDDEQRLLWLAYSDRDPGSYYLMDLTKRSLKVVAPRMGWIKPALMAQTFAVKYPARDGLLVHGYLTVPVGYEAKGLPLVVLPHGGPWVRDVWGFDPLVQLLANRGYAVLQMNYRGSTGYGDKLYREARRQIGGEIQDDIEDATRWAIAAGVADPKRIAIMGMSYGGYSTLFGLGRSPELYRCGISFAGVTDWSAFLEDSDIAEYKSASRHWREQLGDPKKDQDKLRAASPVNFADQITAPVLIIQGKKDARVPQDQAKRMITALAKAGRKPESLFVSNLGHNYGNERQRTEIYQAMVTFLEKHLGPGVP
jgi:dipeptidyl aminopeptidase/acylaminoacyl peptidase